jgi:hypothetical protein
VEWYFRDISNDPSEKELTQQDQFNNDEVVLAEALVRETIQNSTDARLNSGNPVRVRFALLEPTSSQSREFFTKLLSGLSPHLEACQMSVPASGQRFLVIEDFETTGLEGSIENKDNGQFCGFWRRFGRSNKKGTSGGRWGLGKLVFSSSSSIRVLLGLTRRAGSPQVSLMGQAILRNHKVADIEADSVGFWCDSTARKKGLPTTDPEKCRRFCELTGLTRCLEPGLSLVVPYVLPEIEAHHLINATVRNYYFPILTRSLVVEVDGLVIDAGSFDRVLADLGAEAIPASVFSFVREIQSLEKFAPKLTLPKSWQSSPITGDLLGAQLTNELRDRYKTGEMLHIRAPLTVQLKQRDERGSSTYVDLFMKPVQPGERGQTLVVRGSITVPGEGKKAYLPDCHAALLARDSLVSQLLGDSENPAHTQWNERAEKLKGNWSGSHLVLRRIRGVLHELHTVVADRIERDDPEALLDFFSIPKPRQPAGSKGRTERPEGLPPPRQKPFRIVRRAGGFAVVPNDQIDSDALPLKFHLRCAYDVLNGNPFRRFSEHDFSFYSGRLKIVTQGADCWPTDPNEIDVEARSADFELDVVGFDPNRDLIVEAES